MPEREGQRLGNYRLVRLLGKGSFAEVYLGEHLYLKTYAAIKLLLARLNERDEQQFLSEARTLAQFIHPNIVHVHDFAIEHGVPFLAMDYAPGGSLRQRHGRGTFLSLEQTVTYIKQIATALQYAHNRGIIHRDVKPENVLLGPEQLLLSDFGISIHLPSVQASGSQEWAGTLPYIAPEQLRGRAVYASDQYSLAIMAYEWLCGTRPFEGNAMSLAYHHAQTPPPPLREKDPSLPEAVEKVILKALSKDPGDRYVSVITFARVLERVSRESVSNDIATKHTQTLTGSPIAIPRRIFLSHAVNDDVSRLKTDLENRDIVVADLSSNAELHATTGSPSGEEPPAASGIQQAIRAAQIVLLVVSPQTRSSPEVKEHLRIAGIYRRPICSIWAVGDNIRELLPAEARQEEVIDARGQRYGQALDEIASRIEHERRGAPVVEDRPLEVNFEPRNPYKGLRSFTQRDRGDFFGRETLIQEMVRTVGDMLLPVAPGSPAGRLLTVVGPSGSGKSSIAMAGLLPKLQDGAIQNSAAWTYLDPLITGKQPMNALAYTLTARFPEKGVQAVREVLDREGGFGLHQLALAAARQGTRVVLLIDQFEELFSPDIPEAERQHFINLLVTATTEPQGPLLVILTLRADLYDRPLAYATLGRLIQQHQCTVLPMEIEDLRAVIERPALQPDVRLIFEEDLVGDLLYEIRGQAGALPLLEFTLDQLFYHRREQHLTRYAYNEIGGVRGALSRHAESTYTKLPTDQHRRLSQAIFMRLIQPGAAGQDPIRRRADLTEFTLENVEQTNILRETIQAFTTARLLTSNQIGPTTTLEVAHEALLREWPRLADWTRAASEDIRLQQTFSHDVAEWEQRGRPGDRLYRGTQLKEAQAWLERNTASGSEAAFLRFSTKRRQRERISLLVVACLILALLIPAGLLAQQQLTPPTVTTLASQGPGSLRDAIARAPEGSTISFAPNLKGSITLSSGLEIPKNLTIRGPGANLITIYGMPGAYNSIPIDAGKNITISGFTFSALKPQGGPIIVNNGGTLTIDKCTFKNIIQTPASGSQPNSIAAAIGNVGTLTIQDSTITNNTITTDLGGGGAISSLKGATLTIINSQITNNTVQTTNNPPPKSAVTGGAIISSGGKVTLINSTISGNKLTGKAQGLIGGGIYSDHDTLKLTNSTIANNTLNSSDPAAIGSGGGLNASDSTVEITNSHVTDNALTLQGGAFGGGISLQGGSLKLTNSYVMRNFASGGNGETSGGGIDGSADQSNTITDNSGSFITLINSQVANNKLTGNTITHGGGIYVENSTLTLTGSTVTDNTVTSKKDGYGGGIDLKNSALTMTKSTLLRNSANGGDGYASGAGINSLIDSAAGKGGSSITLVNSQVANNTLVSNLMASGGGIHADNTTTALTGSSTTDNTATAPEALGGGITSGMGKLTLTNTTVSRNTAKGTQGNNVGGGIFDEDTLIVTNSIISNNALISTHPGKGGADGGGMAIIGTLNLSNSTISGNTVSDNNGSSNGAGVLITANHPTDTLKLTNCTISDNTATGSQGSDGGGIEAEAIQGTIDFCTIYSNTATTEGGGFATLATNAAQKSNITLKNSLIANNTAKSGPDIMGTITTDGYNLVQNFSGATWNDPANKHATDLSGDKLPDLGIDTQLRASGAATPTHALLASSPALKRIPSGSCDMAVDQRGVKRPQQNACDIGAYEYTQ